MVTGTPITQPVQPMGSHKPFWQQHRIASWAVPLGVLAFLWFAVIQPHTVTTVNEDFPTIAPRPAAPAAVSMAAAPAVASIPAVISNGMTIAAPARQAFSSTRVKGGMLVKVTEGGSGDVTLFALSDGSTIVRLNNLQVPNGPDLRVVLRGPNGADLDLGALKGNAGNQTYPIPIGTDLTKYDTLAIYCRAAHVTFAQAALS